MIRELQRQIVRAALALGLAAVIAAPLIASPGEPVPSGREAARAAEGDPALLPCRVVRRRLWSDQEGWIIRRVPDCR
jgi:hypothetical protein